MAYVVYEILGNQGSLNVEKNNALYTRRFLVNFDDPVYDATIPMNLPEIPSRLLPHPSDVLAGVTKIIPEQHKEDPGTWYVNVEYDRVLGDPNQLVDNPIDKPPKVKWSTSQYDKTLIRDINGNLVCNSAGDLFNPPETIEDSRLNATATYNLTFVPSWIVTYINKINNSDIVVEGVYIPKWCARISSIEVSHWQFENQVRFKQVEVSIQTRDQYQVGKAGIGVYPNGLQASNFTVAGWQKTIQDAGYRQVYSGTGNPLLNILDENGLPIAQPALLDGNGRKLAVPITVGSEIYRVYDVYEERDFSVLNLPT